MLFYHGDTDANIDPKYLPYFQVTQYSTGQTSAMTHITFCLASFMFASFHLTLSIINNLWDFLLQGITAGAVHNDLFSFKCFLCNL